MLGPCSTPRLQGSSCAAQTGEEAESVARLATMLASAAALVATEDSLTEEERRSCCLDAAAGVPAAGPAALGIQPAAVAAAAPAALGAPLLQQQQPATAGWPQAPLPVAVGAAGAAFTQRAPQQQALAANGAGMFTQQPAQPRPIQFVGGVPRPALPGVPAWPQMAMPQPNGQQQLHQLQQQVQQQQLQQLWAQQQAATGLAYGALPAAAQFVGGTLPAQLGGAPPRLVAGAVMPGGVAPLGMMLMQQQQQRPPLQQAAPIVEQQPGMPQQLLPAAHGPPGVQPALGLAPRPSIPLMPGAAGSTHRP